MKRCPECRRDYFDDSLLYCLDDGSALLEGPTSPSEAPTAIYAGGMSERPKHVGQKIGIAVSAVVLIGALVTAGVYWFENRPSPAKSAVPQTAYDNYMRAKVLVANENKEDDETAIRLLEQSVNEAPQYAAAWATLARAYNVKAFFFSSPDERKQLNDNAKVAVEKALALDPNLADAHLARGVLLWTHASRFQHEQAVQSYKRALELDPKLDEAHHQLALIYLHLGLFDKAEAEIGKALEINPANSHARYRYAVINMYRGKYNDAYNISKSTPSDVTPPIQESQGAMILFRLGRIDEAEQTVNRYLSKYPQDEGGIVSSVKAMILAKRGRAQEALAAVKQAEELGTDFGHFHHTAYNIACVYAMLNKPEQAVDYLQRAADDGFPCYPLFERDELLKDINHDPSFITLLARLKGQWERYNATM